MVAIKDGIRQPRPFLLRPNNFPFISSADQFHLTPCPPPVVDFSGTSIPYFFLRDHLSQIIQERFIDVASSTINEIIGMRNKTHQSVSASHERQLLLPQVNRIVIHDVKEGIILRQRERKFEDFADKIWHHRATATSHWFQVRNVRNGHVVGELEDVVPILVTVHGPSPKSPGVVSAQIAIYLFRAAFKLLPFTVQAPVVIEIVDIEFEATPSDLTNIFI